MRRRRADPEAPFPYEGWEDSITVEVPQPKEQVTLRLDRDVLRWFRAHGRGYQTRINAVLRSYYLHERGNADRSGRQQGPAKDSIRREAVE